MDVIKNDDYRSIIGGLVQKQMVVLGPDIALDTARGVRGLVIGNNGEIQNISGDAPMVFKSLVHEYSQLSEEITKMVVHNLLEQYPNVKSI